MSYYQLWAWLDFLWNPNLEEFGINITQPSVFVLCQFDIFKLIICRGNFKHLSTIRLIVFGIKSNLCRLGMCVLEGKAEGELQIIIEIFIFSAKSIPLYTRKCAYSTHLRLFCWLPTIYFHWYLPKNIFQFISNIYTSCLIENVKACVVYW